MAALKYFILKVDPKKRMVFNPAESIDLQGNTGPFIQYTYTRIQSVLRKSGYTDNTLFEGVRLPDESRHRSLLRNVVLFRETVALSAKELNPAVLANYLYDLAKEYNQFYHDFPILKEPDANLSAFRLCMSAKVAETIRKGMYLLGIEVPEKM